MGTQKVLVNRAPVLTLWAAVVAERLGYDAAAAHTFGKAVAGLNAHAKGRRLGIFQHAGPGDGKPAKKSGLGEDRWIELCGRPIPVKKTAAGLRAVVKDDAIDPDKVQGYLVKAFGDDLPAVRAEMEGLARAFDPGELNGMAFSLYEKFRPIVTPGERGWGQKGTLDLGRIRRLADRG